MSVKSPHKDIKTRICVCTRTRVCNQLQQANDRLGRLKKKTWDRWQSSNGVVHIKQTPVTLKKQQRSFCLSFILVLCCAIVNLIPTTAGSGGGSRPFDHPVKAIHKEHMGEKPPPELCDVADTSDHVSTVSLHLSYFSFRQCHHCISLF